MGHYDRDPYSPDYHEDEARLSRREHEAMYGNKYDEIEAPVTKPATRAEVEASISEAAARRSCGDCTACCTIMAVVELDKPRLVRCQHVCEKGCAIYEQRPPTCAAYACAWRLGLGVESMRPDRSGFMLNVQTDPALYAYMGGDPAKPPEMFAAFETSKGGFLTDAFANVRASVLRQAHIVVEVHAVYFRVYGPRFPQGLQLPFVEKGEGAQRHLVVALPEAV